MRAKLGVRGVAVLFNPSSIVRFAPCSLLNRPYICGINGGVFVEGNRGARDEGIEKGDGQNGRSPVGICESMVKRGGRRHRRERITTRTLHAASLSMYLLRLLKGRSQGNWGKKHTDILPRSEMELESSQEQQCLHSSMKGLLRFRPTLARHHSHPASNLLTSRFSAYLSSLLYRFVMYWKRRRRSSKRLILQASATFLILCGYLFSTTKRVIAVAGTGSTTLSTTGQSPTVPAASSTPQAYLVLAVVMFLGGAALAAAETAITTLWPWKVRELAAAEGEDSPFAMLESDLTRFLTTILVATTSATIFSTAIATDHAARIFGSTNVALVTFIMTVLFLFFGEILPKALAVHAPARVARFMVPYIRGLSLIVFPIGKLLASVSTFILRLFNLQMESDVAVSEQELRLIVAGADQSGSIEKYETKLIQNVLDLEEMEVFEVMRPRVDIVALSEESTLFDFLDKERECEYSRIPVFESTVDNITGIVHSKSLLHYLKQGDDIQKILSTITVKDIAQPPYFVPESMSVWNVLEEMRKRKSHLAIVVDEYGGTSGLVTLEDILEEVIYDECDDVEDTAEAEGIKELDNATFEIDGQADLDLVGEVLGLKLLQEDLKDYGTISGYLCDEMDGIPDVGEETVVSGVRFKVTEADDRRILQVTASKLSESEIKALEKEHDSHANATMTDNRDKVGRSRVSKVNSVARSGPEGSRRKEGGGQQVKNRFTNRRTAEVDSDVSQKVDCEDMEDQSVI